MYILKNAIKNLQRNKGRNIILGIIMLTMLSFTAISLIINSTTSSVIKNYKKQFGSKIYIQTDIDKLKELEKKGEMVFSPEIPDEIKLKLADSSYLKETMIEAIYPAYSKKLVGLDQGKNESSGNITTNPIPSNDYYDINLTVKGYNNSELLEDFKEGKRKITSGRMFRNDNETIISEDFAKLNNLKVVDEIEINDCNKQYNFEPLKLKIVGIYYDTTESKYGNYISAATNPKNEILTTYNTMKHYEKEIAKGKNLYAANVTYYLKNPDLLDKFNEEAHKKGLEDIYTMMTDEVSYNKIVKPAENLANVSTTFLVIVLIVGTTVLISLSILSIRERKYEIGVLRSMGMKKTKVVRGILYENLLMTLICLVLSLSIGAFLAQPVASMIANNNYEQSNNNFAIYEQSEKIEVKLSLEAVTSISIIAIVIGLISSSTGILYILKYEPMKILSERN